MKKILKVSFVTFSIVALLLTACSSDGGGDDNNGSIYTLPAPANVWATAYGPTGTIRVSWEPVAFDHSSLVTYDVYRKSEGSNGTTINLLQNFSLPASGGLIGFDDIIDYDNEFKTGVRYTYKVVAKFDTSQILTGGASGWVNSSLDDWGLFQYGSKNSNTVTFSSSGNNALRAAGEKLASPKSLKLVSGTIYGGTVGSALTKTDVLNAIWDGEWGVNYRVAYGIGGGTQVAGSYPLLVTHTSISPATEQSSVAVNIPAIYGDPAVEVVAFKNAGITGVKYYMDSEPAVGSGNFQIQYETPTVTATQIGGSDIIELTITKNNFFEIDSSAYYKIYRFVSSSATYASADTYVYDSWKDITGEVVWEDNNTNWIAYDVTYQQNNLSGNFFYAVVVEKDGARSLPAITSAVPIAYTPTTLNVINLGWDDYTSDFQGIHIWWTPDTSKKYRLLRAELDTTASGSSLTWTTVADTNAIFVADDGGYGLIDQPAYRKSYRYKLEVYYEFDNLNANPPPPPITTSFGSDVTTLPYTNAFDVNLTVTNSPTQTTTNRNAYTTFITLDNYVELQRLLTADESIRISRAPVRNTSGATYSEFDSYVAPIIIAYNFLNDSELTDNPGPGIFRYKAEIVKVSAVSAENTASVTHGNGTNDYISPRAPTINNLPNGNFTLTRTGDSSTLTITQQSNADILLGTELIIIYTGADNLADFNTKVANNVYDRIDERTLTASGITGEYTTPTISTPTSNTYYRVELRYKAANYQSGYGTDLVYFDLP